MRAERERARTGAVVAVHPPSERTARRRLFDALETACGVTIVASGGTEHPHAVVALPGADEIRAPDVPLLVTLRDETEDGMACRLAFARTPVLERVLRGRTAEDAHLPPERIGEEAGDEVVTDDAGRSVWRHRRTAFGEVDTVVAAPCELGADEALRERLMPGRSLALLALMTFLRRVTGPRGWQRAPACASFVLDDPNLHWPSYGYLRFPTALAHADRHGYHLSVGMVPLDGWYAHPRVVELFRTRPDRLSLAVHGNHHRGAELARPGSAAEADAVVAEALARVARFEDRFGLQVARVMIPPHERLSEAAAAALVRCGYDAVCVSRPYPWIAAPSEPWLKRPASAGPLVGFGPADSVAGGLPVLLRTAFGHPTEDLMLRAFLGQPLLVYGHHEDCAGGLDSLEHYAAAVNALDDITWLPLDGIARRAYEWRWDGDAIEVRMYSRCVELEISAEASAVRVDSADGPVTAADVRTGEVISPAADGSLALAGTTAIRLSVAAKAPPPAGHREAPLAAITRRLASEGRDRLAPARRRLGT